ncbi:Membrane-associated guanylate kinase, WW and PDZ domain-containing protein 3 [Anabarilius grahami]|uniref:Membrane-associated guanylate kinase, WW and PDZ domain-containing protein 3 n=1 Tax=Anabarilius grahami TaxID=495550 RepID=A0A3N0YLW6_ANAGA|nr:Membrane-associated guanylate kinase, WW and PDZ domain-containing protein 3 [Anabarilius grahami]
MDQTRCPAFGVYASCPKLFLGRLVGPYAYVYGSCPCRQNQRQMEFIMSKTLKKKKHWSSKVQECAVSWGNAGELSAVLEISGGAEHGEFPHLGQVLSDALVCHVGRLPGPGDVLLEVNGTPVSGLTNRDTLAVVRHFREPLRLKTVKPG